MLKLAIGAGMHAEAAPPSWLRARLHLDAPSLPLVLEAVAARKRIKFKYRGVGRSADTERIVDPYALIHLRGAWYVVGRDHSRDAVRHFILQRITSDVRHAVRGSGPDFEVPDDFSVERHSVAEPWAGEEGVEAEVAFSPRIAWWVEQSLGLKPVATWRDWTVVRINVVDEDGFLSWVMGFGEDAILRKPARLRQAIVERLRRLGRARRARARVAAP